MGNDGIFRPTRTLSTIRVGRGLAAPTAVLRRASHDPGGCACRTSSLRSILSWPAWALGPPNYLCDSAVCLGDGIRSLWASVRFAHCSCTAPDSASLAPLACTDALAEPPLCLC